MARYPSILAGQKITAALLQSMQWQEFWKTAHTDRVSTATFADDPDLQCSLEANATYRVEMFLHYAATNVSRFMTQWRLPAGASGNRTCVGADQGVILSSNSSGGTGRWGVHNFDTDATYGTRNDSGNQCIAQETATIITSNAGTMALQWCQATSSTDITRLALGTYMRVRRIG